MNASLNHFPLQIIEFMVNDINMCMDIQYIDKVLSLPMLETVPGSSHEVAGIMNYRNQNIFVIDMGMRLKLPRNNRYTANTPLLLCSHHLKKLGIVVDQIVGFSAIEKNQIQTEENFDKKNTLFLASITLNSKVLLLLNTEEIITTHLIEKTLP